MIYYNDFKENWGTVIIIGHILTVGDQIYDLRMPDSPYPIGGESNLMETNIFDTSQESDFMCRLNTMLMGWLGTEAQEGWGEDEDSWMWAINHEDEQFRAMAALEGLEGSRFSKDESSWVRDCTVQSLINAKLQGKPLDDGFLDQMLDDPDEMVLSKIATYGKRQHLNALLDSDSLIVLMQIAKHDIKEHIQFMSTHGKAQVRLLAALYSEDKSILKEMQQDKSNNEEVLQVIGDRLALFDKKTKLSKLIKMKAEGEDALNSLLESFGGSEFLNSLSYTDSFLLIDKGIGLFTFSKNANSDLVQEKALEKINEVWQQNFCRSCAKTRQQAKSPEISIMRVSTAAL